MSSSLQQAISAVVERALTRVSDRILRLEASKDWPIGRALTKLNETVPIRALVQRPFKVGDFSGLKTTENAGTATNWRNSKGRDYSVVIIGSSTGNLDAGLKDVRRLPRGQIIDEWGKRVIKEIGAKGDLAKYEVQRLLSELFKRVSNGELPTSQVEAYLKAISSDATVNAVCDNLWRIGLIPDRQAVDSAMAGIRLTRNRELVYQLRESDDPKFDTKLRNAEDSADPERSSVAKAALLFRESGRSEHLKSIQLPILEEILKSTAASPGRGIEFSDLLDLHLKHPEKVADCLAELKSQWSLDDPPASNPYDVEATLELETEKQPVRLKLHPSTKEIQDEDDSNIVFDTPWTGDESTAGILAAESSKPRPEFLGPNQIELTDTKFKDLAPPGIDVTPFLDARRALRKYEPWLERDSFGLLVLHDEAREAVRTYLNAWIKLAEDASGLEDEPNFVETVQVLETIQGQDELGNPAWIVLGPLHPFRLDPFLRVADRIVDCLRENDHVVKLGEAADWMIDRSYPAYPTIHRNRSTLHLISHRGSVIYSKNPGQYLPPVREANGLDRIFRAIEGYSPWLADGMSVLTIDAPEGGGVVRALENARQRRSEGSLHVYHLTTGDETDTLDGFNGEVEYLPRVVSQAVV